MLAAGAGGLVVGGLAGAALAGDSSDDGKLFINPSSRHCVCYTSRTRIDNIQNITHLLRREDTVHPQRDMALLLQDMILVMVLRHQAIRRHSSITLMSPLHSVSRLRRHVKSMRRPSVKRLTQMPPVVIGKKRKRSDENMKRKLKRRRKRHMTTNQEIGTSSRFGKSFSRCLSIHSIVKYRRGGESRGLLRDHLTRIIVAKTSANSEQMLSDTFLIGWQHLAFMLAEACTHTAQKQRPFRYMLVS